MFVRRARADDANVLTALYRELVPNDPNIRVDPAALARDDPHDIVLVVEHDGTVRGTALLSICRDVMYGAQPFGVIENVIVQAGARRLGLGRALFAELEAIARARHCTKLMLLSAATRPEAHAFFAAHGFDGSTKKAFVRYLNRG